jgi:hypothetical protein
MRDKKKRADAVARFRDRARSGGSRVIQVRLSAAALECLAFLSRTREIAKREVIERLLLADAHASACKPQHVIAVAITDKRNSK